MSDSQQGPDWWRASDGKWYPPEQTPGGPPVQTPPGASPTATAAGLVRDLYDVQFDSFVTPRLIRLFYGFFLVVVSFVAVLFLVGGVLSGDAGVLIATVLFVPIVYLAYLIIGRISFELIAVIFRMSDDLRAIRQDPRA